MKNIFAWFTNPKTPELPKSKVAELTDLVEKLNKESRCKSAMNYILRSLDYEQDNPDVLNLARLIVGGCTSAFHTCHEPLSEMQINDYRLDHMFNECAKCSHHWIPAPSAFIPWIAPEDWVLTSSSTGLGGYCPKCKKAFCREHVAEPLPSIKMGLNPHCSLCGSKLDCHHVHGRKARQAPRQNQKLSCVVLVREGLVPPDKEYCLKVFRASSNDVLEDLPYTIGMNFHPWEYNAEVVFNKVKNWLKTQPHYNFVTDQMAIWSGMDSQSKTRFHLIKFWGTLPRVTLGNLFTIPPYSENFPFETATISDESLPESQMVFQNEPSTLNSGNIHLSNADLVQEFISLFQQYVFKELSHEPDPSQLSQSQKDVMPDIVFNRACDVLIRKYNLSEQEAAIIGEQATAKIFADLTNQATNISSFEETSTICKIPVQKDIPVDKIDMTRSLDAGKLVQDLFKAVEGGQTEQVKDLLNSGIDVKKAKRSNGDTPLHVAAFLGYTEIAQMLITKGGEVNVGITGTTDPGATPLHLSAMKGHSEIVFLLLNNGARVDVRLGGEGETSTSGATPLHLAATHNQIDVVNILVRNRADLETMDDYGDTALHYASNQGLADMVRELVRLGANVNASDLYERTPLSIAKENGSIEVIRILKNAGAH
jgi:ankyrin repeat protein